MDANRQRFWLLAAARHWAPDEHLRFDHRRGTLRLASERLRDVDEDAARAEALLSTRRRAVDAFETWAMWRDAEPGVDPEEPNAPPGIFAGGAVPGERRIFRSDPPPDDFCVDVLGVLYLALDGAVVLHDLRDRWDDTSLTAADFTAGQLAAHPEGGVWALDRTRRALAQVTELPLPRRPYAPYGPGVFRPDEEDPRPPSIRVAATLDASLDPVALAVSPDGRVGVICWRADADAVLVRLDDQDRPLPPIELVGARWPYSLTWLSGDRIAIMQTNLNEARAYLIDAPLDEWAEPAPELPHGDLYPLQRELAGDIEPFTQGLKLPPRYPDDTERLRKLHKLSARSLARHGQADNLTRIDSRDPRTVWHRLYLEAALPPGTSVTVSLAASDDYLANPASDPTLEWFPHRFGGGPTPGIPHAAWVSQPSELPVHPGLLPCAPERDRTGLFTVLIQRSGRRTTRLVGRFLYVRVDLWGNGRTSPEIAGLRAYASRFSYAEKYLPELYREQVFGPDGDVKAEVTTRADFLERFLANFEGVLTPAEDRIAWAHLLTHPNTVPADSLEWLASWVGFSLDPAHPPDRQRALLAAAMELHRWRGTRRGLELALDITTNGGVQDGRIVVVEDWRLRRTFATILGADLADEQDELVAGLAVSGNSYVGDTLVLGRTYRREFLALFDAEVDLRAWEERAITRFFDRFAHRVTILVQREAGPELLGLVREVVEHESPAHVQTRVVAARHPLVVGLWSLIAVDTYLGVKPEKQPVRVDRSRIGERDFLLRPASLDPRLEGGAG